MNCSLWNDLLGNNPVNISPSCGIWRVQTKTTAAGSKARILQQQRFKIQVNIYFGPEHLRTSCYLRMNNAPRRISVAYLDSDLPKGEPMSWPWPYLEKEVNVRNTVFRQNWAFLEVFTLKKGQIVGTSFFFSNLQYTIFPTCPVVSKRKALFLHPSHPHAYSSPFASWAHFAGGTWPAHLLLIGRHGLCGRRNWPMPL